MDDYDSIYSGEEIDARLTAVGRKIEMPSSAYAGKVPRANGMGGVDWVNIGQPTDAQTAAAISAWLAAHPEATTTVLPGSITTDKLADGAVTGAKTAGGVYGGANLTSAHAAEIGTQSPWAWIKGRIQTGNYSGIRIGDYIPFTAGGNVYNAQVAGIDSYFRYGDSNVPHHIDFICDKLWNESHAFNQAAFNNGISTEAAPWLCSDLYYWMNSRAGTVPTGAGTTAAVNYTAAGVYNALPLELQAVIAEKGLYIETRYNGTGTLTDSNSNAWKNIGKLWLPTELEVFGICNSGSPFTSTRGSFGQYPIYKERTRVMYRAGGGRSTYWLLNPSSGASNSFCAVHSSGFASRAAATTAAFVPICFRIA